MGRGDEDGLGSGWLGWRLETPRALGVRARYLPSFGEVGAERRVGLVFFLFEIKLGLLTLDSQTDVWYAFSVSNELDPLSKLQAAVREFQAREERVDNRGL